MNMSEIIYDENNDIVILRVIGKVTFTEITEAVKQYFSRVTRHLIWDYTHGDLSNVTADDFRSVPNMSAKYFTYRKHGRTAFACPDDLTFGMFRMYSVFADIKCMPYEYEVFRSIDDATKWVQSYRDSVS
jgi:hypothetical protein